MRVRELAHQPASPYQEPSDGRKDKSNDEKRRQNGFRCQYGLPRLQSLLLEGGVWKHSGMR